MAEVPVFVIYEFEVREGYLAMQVWIVDEWHSIVCSLFNLFGRDFLWVLYRFAAASHIGLAGIAR